MTDKPEGAQREHDPRLVEIVAACLCWAEFLGHDDRDDDPFSYWEGVAPHAKLRYMRDAELIACVMMTDRYYAIVPVEPTSTMIDRAMNARRGIRSIAGARETLQEMVAGARFDLKWRSGDIEDSHS